MSFNARRQGKFQKEIRQRLRELRAKTEESLDFAIETLMLDRVDTYFKVEEGFTEIDRMATLIEQELDQVEGLSKAQRLQSRLEFIEDRFEELDSEMRQRPMRRRRKINFFEFFKAAGGGSRSGGDSESGVRGEINSLSEAYEALGLQMGTPMADVTRAFRRRAKHLHPDARNGDRSSEPEFRRIIEAYEFLKDHLG